MNSYDDCKAIVELDLDPIKVKLMHKQSGEGWTLEQANAVETEYRRYLYLAKTFPNEHVAPVEDVDTFWHYHILDTMKYAKDCQEIFGYFLHHFPYAGMRGEEDLGVLQQLGERTRALYEQTFGDDYHARVNACREHGTLASSPAFCLGATVQAAGSGATAPAFCNTGNTTAFCNIPTTTAFCSGSSAGVGKTANLFSVRPKLEREAVAA